MQQFVFPQFIDVETKIIGPITIRQFVLLAIGGFMTFLYRKVLDNTAFTAATTGTAIVVIIIAFVKINARPFHEFLLRLLINSGRAGSRVWNKDQVDAYEHKHFLMERAGELGEERKAPPIPIKGFLTQSRLSDLALLVDTGGLYSSKGGVAFIKSIESASFRKSLSL